MVLGGRGSSDGRSQGGGGGLMSGAIGGGAGLMSGARVERRVLRLDLGGRGWSFEWSLGGAGVLESY